VIVSDFKIFKYRTFHRWAKKEKIPDSTLKNAVDEINAGLFEANLGGHLYKKRIVKPGKGKRGGYRMLIAFKNNTRAFFIYGFAKNEQSNITEKELEAHKRVAQFYLDASEMVIEKLLTEKNIIEITDV